MIFGTCNKQKIQRGFTLVELLLYIGIASVIIVGLSLFISTAVRSRARNAIQAEVETQGTQAFQIMTQTIRNATDADVVE